MSRIDFFRLTILLFLPVSLNPNRLYSPPSHPYSTGPFREIEQQYPAMVAVDSRGQITGQVMDFRESQVACYHAVHALTVASVQSERLEMRTMSKSSEVSTNVWQGPTPEHLLRSDSFEPLENEEFDLLIDTTDLANIPEPYALSNIERQLRHGPQRLEFPSSGSVLAPSSDQQVELHNLVNTLRWMHYLANPGDFACDTDSGDDIDIITPTRKACKILIHCPDGYTESSLLTLAYVIFAEGIPAKDAWLKLHRERNRNFFAYPMDVSYLSAVQAILLQESPATPSLNLSSLSARSWFDNCDGSLPSRVLPYMYLGSLTHANNPEMLHALGIHRVLSIGESVTWSEETYGEFGQENVMHITQVQDNGIDSLTNEFSRCLEFIREFFPR